MTDKELRRLNRMELIQLLLEQTKELERTQRELAAAQEALEDRRIKIRDAGSIAEAAVQINQVMEAAQKAADQYLENIQRKYGEWAESQYAKLERRLQEMEDAARKKCDAMLEDARREADSYGKSR